MTPFEGGTISDSGVIPDPIGPLPPIQSLAGWPSMLQEGAETPVFDWVTIIHGPINPTDGVNKAYVDAAVAIGGPITDPLLLPVSVEITGSLTVAGPVILSGSVILPNLPLDNAGLAPGTLWNNAGVVSVA
jgi:hypothetical protein